MSRYLQIQYWAIIVNDLAKCGRKRSSPRLFSISNLRTQCQRKYYGEIFPLLRISSVAFTRFSAYFLQTSSRLLFFFCSHWRNRSDKRALPAFLFAQWMLVNNQNYASEKKRERERIITFCFEVSALKSMYEIYI